MSRSVVVVGGGVIGAACAHYLQREGWSVRILDKDRFGAACSQGNCGYVCPSHVLPLAEPGAVRKTLRAMLRKGSPFYIKPRFSPALWGWLMRFARRCNEACMMSAARAIGPMLESAMELYEHLVEKEGLECEWEKRGLLYVYGDRELFESYAATDKLLGEVFGHPARRLVGEEVTQFEPALKSGLAGGWFYPCDAHLRPEKLMSSWRSRLESNGATFMENTELRGFVRRDGRAVALQTSSGEISADAFVIATGAWTPMLARELGCRIPIQPGKGYSITMPRPAVCPMVPMIFPETRVAVTPWPSGYRLGSTMEFAGYDESIKPARIGLLRSGAEAYLRQPYCEPVEKEWFGWRPMTYDSLPIIGRSPVMDNVMIAAGHNMVGISMAPATGKLVAEMLSGTTPHLDPAPYSPSRF